MRGLASLRKEPSSLLLLRNWRQQQIEFGLLQLWAPAADLSSWSFFCRGIRKRWIINRFILIISLFEVYCVDCNTISENVGWYGFLFVCSQCSSKLISLPTFYIWCWDALVVDALEWWCRWWQYWFGWWRRHYTLILYIGNITSINQLSTHLNKHISILS